MMDSAYRTPLVDLFRRGDVAREIRMLAARGVLAPRAQEQLALLVLLARDPDEGIRLAAEETMRRIPVAAVEGFLARSDVSADVREFWAGRGVAASEVPSSDVDAPLVELPDEPGANEGDRVGAAERLAQMGVIDRLKTAMRGTREERALLIRDHNKMVAAAVLSNPRLQETEVEVFARMANVSEEVLRTIGHTRAWAKNYGVVQALTRNPKTPVALSLTLLPRLNERDAKLLVTDRNVPEPLRLAARKTITAGDARRR
jgi:hypothetical protein